MILLTLLPTYHFFIYRFPLHCLHSVSELLEGIISNAFMVNVDKFLDAPYKHVER